jgi:hypothetical protein
MKKWQFWSKFLKNAIFLLPASFKMTPWRKFLARKAFNFLSAVARSFFSIDKTFGLMRKHFKMTFQLEWSK